MTATRRKLPHLLVLVGVLVSLLAPFAATPAAEAAREPVSPDAAAAPRQAPEHQEAPDPTPVPAPAVAHAIPANLVAARAAVAEAPPVVAPAGDAVAAMAGPELLVNTSADIIPAVCDLTMCTLRGAVERLIAEGTGGTVTFDASMAGARIVLMQNLVLNGPPITIDGEITGDGVPDVTITHRTGTPIAIRSAGNTLTGVATSMLYLFDQAHNNRILNNFLGIDPALAPLAPGHSALILDEVSGNVIAGNLIGGATDPGNLPDPIAGVLLTFGAQGNRVYGNYIGVTPDGRAIPNEFGIVVNQGALENMIGSNDAAARLDQGANVIGHNAVGVGIFGATSYDNIIGNNQIGATLSGGAIPNGYGILVGEAVGTIIGRTADGLTEVACSAGCNLISGNLQAGIQIESAARSTSIDGNYIGVDAAGLTAIPNRFGVVILSGAEGNGIGSSRRDMTTACDQLCNVISGNTNAAVYMGGVGTKHNFLGHNFVGISPVENDGDYAHIPNAYGVVLDDGTNGNFVGLTPNAPGLHECLGLCNRIVGNTFDGVVIKGEGTTGNTIRGNYILDNGRYAIDQGGDGVTLNDRGDTDKGPNDLLNAPTSIASDFDGTRTIITGVLPVPNPGSYSVDLYEGWVQRSKVMGVRRFMGTATPGADGRFTLSIAGNVATVVAGIAVDDQGNTSEISEAGPLIIIPGLGGSRLVDVANDEELWPGDASDQASRLKLHLAYDDLVPPIGRSAQQVVATSLLTFTNGVRDLSVYGMLLEWAEGEYRPYADGGDPAKRTLAGCDLSQRADAPNLFVFPYDWRKDLNLTAAQLADYVGCVQQFHPGAQVKVVAHGTGGILARRYILQHPDHKIGRVVSMNTPWMGVNLTAMLNNDEFTRAPLPYAAGEETALAMQSWTGLHQLAYAPSFYEDGSATEIYEGESWNYNGDDRAGHLYSYDQVIEALDRQFPLDRPGTAARDFASLPGQYDWRNDTSGVRYLHIVSLQSKPATIAYLETGRTLLCAYDNDYGRCNALRTPVMTPHYDEGDGFGMSTSMTRQFLMTNYNAPTSSVVIQRSRQAREDYLYSHYNLATQDAQLALYLSDTYEPSPPRDTTNDEGAATITIIGAATPVRVVSPGGQSGGGTSFGDSRVVQRRMGDRSYALHLTAGQPYTITFTVDTQPFGVFVETFGLGLADPFINYQDMRSFAPLHMQLTMDEAHRVELRGDAEGDGVYEIPFRPSAGADPFGPELTINVDEATRTLTLSASDEDGVKQLFYSTDGGLFQPYYRPVTIDVDGGVVAFADDNLGNRTVKSTRVDIGGPGGGQEESYLDDLGDWELGIGGVAVGPSGRVYVSKFGSYRMGIPDTIERVNPGFDSTSYEIEPGMWIDDMVVAPDGNLWYGTRNGNIIGKLTPTGQRTDYGLGEVGIGGIYDLTVGPDGNVWFTIGDDASKIGRITPSGQVTGFDVPGLGLTYGITVGPDGNIWFTRPRNNQVGRLDGNGQFTLFNLPPTSIQPREIVAGRDGYLYVTRHGFWGGGEVLRMTTRGTVAQTYNIRVREGGDILFYRDGGKPQGITVGPDGNIWFTLVASQMLGRIDQEGLLRYFHSPVRWPAKIVGDEARDLIWVSGWREGGLGVVDLNGRTRPIPTPTDITEVKGIPPTYIEVKSLARGGTGRLWVRSSSAYLSIGPDGSLREFPRPGAPAGPGIQSLAATAAAPHDARGMIPDGACVVAIEPGALNRICPDSASASGYSLQTLPFTLEGSDPRGVTLGPDGAYWFADAGANGIGRIARDGAFRFFPLGRAGSAPTGIAAGPDGALWFTQAAGNRIGRITTGGALSEVALPQAGAEPFDIIAGPDGALWFSLRAAGQVGRVTTGGEVRVYDLLTANAAPTQLALGADGAVWVSLAAAGKVARVTPDGEVLEVSLPAESAAGLSGLTLGEDGAIWAQTGTALIKVAAETAPQRTLTITVEGEGSVQAVPGDGVCAAPGCALAYAEGVEVSLVATPAPGFRLAGWAGACAGADACSVSMGADRAVTARFERASVPPPDTAITAAPSGTVTTRAASVSFTGTGGSGALRFECSLDGAAFAACASPLALSGLADGEHTLAVRAVDAAGQADATPATATWSVDATAPTTTAQIAGTPASGCGANCFTGSVVVTLTSSEAGVTDYSVNGGATQRYGGPITLGEPGQYTLSIFSTDPAGNVETARSLSLRIAAPVTPTVPMCYETGVQSWQDYRPGLRKDGRPILAQRTNPNKALGMPQRTDTENFVSLGFGGSLTLVFSRPIVNDGTAAPDIRVWETSFGDATRSWSRYPEAARIFASADGSTWTEIGRTTDKDQAYDLVLPEARFIRLVDVSDPARFGATDDGFDIDAVEVLTGCRP